MRKFRLLVSVLVAVAAIAFALRHRVLRELKTTQSSVEQPAEVLAHSSDDKIEPKSDAGPSAEHLELLRLRGEITMLRREVTTETNELAKLLMDQKPGSATGTNQVVVVTKEEAKQRLRGAKQVVSELLMQADKLGGHFIPFLSMSISENSEPSGTFSLVYHGIEGEASMRLAEWPTNADSFRLEPEIEGEASMRRSRIILVRELQPWWGTNDQWNRVYGFLDGHSEIATSETTDFSEWEKQKDQQSKRIKPDAEQIERLKSEMLKNPE